MSKLARYYLYLTVFLNGAAVLLIEILGTRVISPFYGTTVFVWTSLITVALSALALGYYTGGRVADKFPKPITLNFLVICAGLVTLLPKKIDQYVLLSTDNLGIKYGPLVAAIILFFAPFFLMGMISPYAIRLLTRKIETTGSTAGKVFAISTAGSIVGGLLAGFYLLDHYTITASLNYTGLILMMIGGLGVVHEFNIKRVGGVGLLALLAVVLWVSPSYTYQETRRIFKFVEHRQSFYGDLKIKEDDKYRCLLLNGVTHNCHLRETNKPVWSYVFEISRLIKTRDQASVLILGLGAGSIARLIPEEVEADFVEIDEEVVSLAEEYFDFKVASNQRVIIDDARHFLRSTDKTYDIIVLDVFLGNIFPVHLFTVEFLQEMSNHLNDGGVALAFLEGINGDTDEQFNAFHATATQVFPRVVWTSNDPSGEPFLLAHFSPDPLYEPAYARQGEKPVRPFREIEHTAGKGVVLRDDFNPLDTIATQAREISRTSFVSIQGYTPFFVN